MGVAWRDARLSHWCFVLVCVATRFTGVLGAITVATVTPASQIAGVTGAVDVAFTTGTAVAVGGSIVVVFPTTFYVNVQLLSLSNVVGFDFPASTIAIGSNSYSVIVTIAGTDVAAGPISFTIDGVSNPGEGTTAVYIIRTQDTNGNTIESTSNTPTTVILQSPFADATLSVSTPNAGAQAEFALSFTTAVTLRVGSRIELEFPSLPTSKFVFGGAFISSRSGIDSASGIISTTVPFLRIAVAGQDISAATKVSLTFDNIYLPAEQPIGTFSIRSRHSAGTVFQESTNIVGLTIQRTSLSATATVTPLSHLAGMVTSYSISFPTAAFLPVGSKITVVFPARFKLTSATLASVNNMPSTNAVLTKPSSTTVVLTLGAGPVLAGLNRGFTLVDVVNPGTSCNQYIYDYCTPAWGDYSITITDAADNVYESSTTVPGTPILKKLLVFARVRPTLKQPNTLTSATVIFDTQATIPVGGTIDVIFPTGYTIGNDVSATNHVGIPSASTSVTVTGLHVSLAVADFSIPPTSRLAVTFSNITTPPSSATGMYIVRTRDDQGQRILEELETITGEGCLYLNSCNGHGTCTLFSSTCVCDEGWGAPNDIAKYRSPDCTTRVCPSGNSWNSIPSGVSTSHEVVEECSGMGVCDRNTGRCLCFPGFTGAACQRMTCPNNCSGRGRCVSMKELATAKNGLPLSPPTSYEGAKWTTTWDEDRIYGCVCDSSWAVGVGTGEVQATEFFGGDCSRRHCPSGNDPETPADETACSGLTAPGGYATGDSGNICHVECSRRGICNYKTGVCLCFPGYTGFACQLADALSK